MSDDDFISRIHDILPDYDRLPALLDSPKVAEIIGVKLGSLIVDRVSRRRFGIGFVRVGRLIKYPKTEVAKFLLRGAVGVGENDAIAD